MYRTNHCGELRMADVNKDVVLAGWVQKNRGFGGMTFIDLRDRYGITQLFFDQNTNAELCERASKLGREFVIQIHGKVLERSNKNPNIPTGEIEIAVSALNILNESDIPPFTIEDETDGGEDLRMKYRYLDLRRNPIRRNLELRHRLAIETRNFLDKKQFIEVETPVLIKSTPEGARDFVVPSRVNEGQFFALPQSPQLFKQLLMVSGFDRYYQIVKCFRDEDLRADRQPEFTQIDCEMSFVDQDDILNLFEELVKHLFKVCKNIDIDQAFLKMPYTEAIEYYGSDKPDLRFDMKICEITSLVKGKGFKVFEDAAYIGGICVKGASEKSRKELDDLTEYVKRPQVGAKGLFYAKWQNDDTIKSSADKFFTQEDFKSWAQKMNAEKGDLMLFISGEKDSALKILGELRLEVARREKLMKDGVFVPLWVVDFPLFEWDAQTNRYYAIHHPFTAPKAEHIDLLNQNPASVYANAYDLVINGVEIGGGSIRIHNNILQRKIFEILGFTEEQAQEQFGFLLGAFKYGAPPHGGIAFGFDRLTAILAGCDTIRDVIAFPKNNAARDMMIDAPSEISVEQLKELAIQVVKSE